LGFSIGMNAVGGVGGGTSVDFNWLIKGEEASWSPIITVSQSMEVGMNISPISVSLNTYEFWGKTSPLRSYLQTSLAQEQFGVTYSAGISNWGGSFSGAFAGRSYITSASAIFSVPANPSGFFSVGLFNSYMIKR
jgi:hypothetical protein